MDIIKTIFDYISGLGSTVMIPIMIMIVGLVVRLKFKEALKSGMLVGIGFIGLNIVLGLVWTNISPVAQTLVDKFHLHLNTIDVGWGAAAGLAFSTGIGSFIIPFIILINLGMLLVRLTKTVNIDIWNYWHYAFTGSVVYLLTNNVVYGFIAAAIHCVVALKVADLTAHRVQKYLGVPGISIPQGFAVTTVPIVAALDKFYDLFIPKAKRGLDPEVVTTDNKNNNVFLRFLKAFSEPIFLGALIGILLGIVAGNTVQQILSLAMSMAGLMFLLPRMTKIMMEGLLPISNQARDFMQKRAKGGEFFIGLDSAVLLGLSTTMSVGLLLIPIMLILAAILPGNSTIPVGDLAAAAFFISMATPMHKGRFWRTLISGIIIVCVVLLCASYFAPMLTTFAKSGSSIAIPDGAVQITALSAGNLYALIIHLLAKLHLVGISIAVLLTGAFVYVCKIFEKRNEKKADVKQTLAE